MDGVSETNAKRGPLDGAVGAGLVLIVLPCVAVYFGVDRLFEHPIFGLPIIAIFGIMMLFGALALVASLFAGMGLSDPQQALGLPDGSIRAAIALSLIVLFAIISIMLYQSISKPYEIAHVSKAAVDVLVKDTTSNHVVAVIPECHTEATDCTSCTASTEPCPQMLYTVDVLQPQGREATDLAKQLLILIGTLMTSVTSFYFASRSGPSTVIQTTGTAPNQPSSPSPLPSSDVDPAANVDGCNVQPTSETKDEELPAATGGVQ
jgi:TRAP-type C4-dicarboxylate transport system permease small subunit